MSVSTISSAGSIRGPFLVGAIEPVSRPVRARPEVVRAGAAGDVDERASSVLDDFVPQPDLGFPMLGEDRADGALVVAELELTSSQSPSCLLPEIRFPRILKSL